MLENRKKGSGYVNNVVRKSLIWIWYVALMAFAEYCFLALQIKIWRGYGQSYCMLDCMHAMEAPWNFGLFYLPITAWWIMADRNVYQYTAFVLQYKRREKIWSASVRNTAVRSMICSGIYGTIACLLSGLSSYEVMNWKVGDSLYYQINEAPYQGYAASVFLSFFWMNIMKTILVVMILMLFESCQKGLVMGYMLLVIEVIVEWCFADANIFLNFFSIAHKNFKNPGTIWIRKGVIFVLIFIIYLAGKSIWANKEFNEHN